MLFSNAEHEVRMCSTVKKRFSSNKIQNGDILVLANPGPPGNAVKMDTVVLWLLINRPSILQTLL